MTDTRPSSTLVYGDSNRPLTRAELDATTGVEADNAAGMGLDGWPCANPKCSHSPAPDIS